MRGGRDGSWLKVIPSIETLTTAVTLVSACSSLWSLIWGDKHDDFGHYSNFIVVVVFTAGIILPLLAAFAKFVLRRKSQGIIFKTIGLVKDGKPRSSFLSDFYARSIDIKMRVLSGFIAVLSAFCLAMSDVNSFFVGFTLILMLQLYALTTNFRSAKGYLGGNAFEAYEMIVFLRRRSKSKNGRPPFHGISSKYDENDAARRRLDEVFAGGQVALDAG